MLTCVDVSSAVEEIVCAECPEREVCSLADPPRSDFHQILIGCFRKRNKRLGQIEEAFENISEVVFRVIGEIKSP